MVITPVSLNALFSSSKKYERTDVLCQQIFLKIVFIESYFNQKIFVLFPNELLAIPMLINSQKIILF